MSAMSAAEMRRALTAYVEAVNRHDVDAMMALRHPEAYLHVMGLADPVGPRDVLGDFYREFFSTMVTDYRLEIHGETYDEPAATGVVWGEYTATIPAEFLGTDTQGGPVRVPALFVCEFRDGLFRGDHMYAQSPQAVLTAAALSVAAAPR